MRKWTILLLICVMCITAQAQDEKFPQTMTVGLEFRPLFPANFLKTGDQQVSNSQFSVLVSPKFSFSAGMTLRYGFHKRFALETGLNFVQRHYGLNVHRDSTSGNLVWSARPEYDSNTDFTIIGYEHPIKLLVFVKLSERFFMNAAGGVQITFFPSDISSSDSETSPNDQYFKHSSLRLGFDGRTGPDGFIHGGAIANLGWEYRTKKIGFFYLGATYHIPFASIYNSRFQYIDDSYESEVQNIALNGSYLTFDVRYFFHSRPLLPKKKKVSKNKEKTIKPERIDD